MELKLTEPEILMGPVKTNDGRNWHSFRLGVKIETKEMNNPIPEFSGALRKIPREWRIKLLLTQFNDVTRIEDFMI